MDTTARVLRSYARRRVDCTRLAFGLLGLRGEASTALAGCGPAPTPPARTQQAATLYFSNDRCSQQACWAADQFLCRRLLRQGLAGDSPSHATCGRDVMYAHFSFGADQSDRVCRQRAPCACRLELASHTESPDQSCSPH